MTTLTTQHGAKNWARKAVAACRLEDGARWGLAGAVVAAVVLGLLILA